MGLERKKLLNQRHVMWNWKQSPDNPELVRLQMVAYSDKKRESLINKILEDSQNKVAANFHFDLIRTYSGSVKGSKMNFLLRTYDTEMNPDLLDFSKINPIARKNDNLYERQVGKIEDYVERFYNGK